MNDGDVPLGSLLNLDPVFKTSVKLDADTRGATCHVKVAEVRKTNPLMDMIAGSEISGTEINQSQCDGIDDETSWCVFFFPPWILFFPFIWGFVIEQSW